MSAHIYTLRQLHGIQGGSTVDYGSGGFFTKIDLAENAWALSRPGSITHLFGTRVVGALVLKHEPHKHYSYYVTRTQ
jgi:hypothetical protein